MLDDVHPGRVHAVAGSVRPVVAVVAVLHHHREPGRPVGQLLDLLGLVEDHAVRAQPAAAPDRTIEHRPVPGAADVGLGVHGERDAAPGLDLPLGHVHEGALGQGGVRDRARVVARVSLAPEAVHHQVGELDEGVAVELGREQLVEIAKGPLELGVVVAGLDPVRAPGNGPPDRDERHLRLEKVGESELRGLDLRVGELNAEGEALAVSAGGVTSEGPDRVEVEPARTALHVAPVAADVEHVHERQRGEALDRQLERFLARSRRERRAVLLPRVPDEAEAGVADAAGAGRRRGDRVPALVLLDAEGALVQPVGDDRAGAEVVALPEVRAFIGTGERRPHCGQRRARLQELPSPCHRSPPARAPRDTIWDPLVADVPGFKIQDLTPFTPGGGAFRPRRRSGRR